MLRHFETLTATRSRVFILMLVPILLTAFIFNSAKNLPFENFDDAIAATSSIASLISILLIANWIGDDLDKYISHTFLYKDNRRKKFVLERFLAVYAMAFLITFIFVITTIFFYPPSSILSILKSINTFLTSLSYAAIVSGFAFIFKNSVSSLVSTLFIIFFWESGLRFILGGNQIIYLFSPESYIGRVATSSANLYDYIFCISLVLFLPVLSAHIFKRKKM